MCCDGGEVVSIRRIGRQVAYDFSVERYHNYIAGGLVHHNTFIGIAEDLSYSLGYRPWLPLDDPDRVIDVRVPNIGLIGCETAVHSVSEKIGPLLRLLIPRTCGAEFRPGPSGYLSRVILHRGCYGERCGSTIYIRSYVERPDSFEGIDYDGFVHWDEPPPLGVFKAVERGKVVSNAASWFTMTPLKEPWVLSMLSSRAATVI